MIKNFGIYLILALLLFSCKENDVAPMSENETDIKINITSRGAINDDNLVNDGEWVINRVRIYAFDGTVLDRQIYIGDITADNNGYYETVMKVKPNSNKTIIVVVNESDNMHATLNAVTTPSDLDNIKFNLADYTTSAYISETRPDGFNLPMYGAVSAVNATGSNSINVDVDVTRAVARVDLYFKSDVNTLGFNKGMKLLVSNISTYGYLKTGNLMTDVFAESVLYTMGTAETYTVPIAATEAEATRFCTFYMPERVCLFDDEKVWVKLLDVTAQYVDGASTYNFLENFQYPLDKLNEAGKEIDLLHFNRNNLYKVVGTFTEKEFPIVFSVSINAWTPESHDIIM